MTETEDLYRSNLIEYPVWVCEAEGEVQAAWAEAQGDWAVSFTSKSKLQVPKNDPGARPHDPQDSPSEPLLLICVRTSAPALFQWAVPRAPGPLTHEQIQGCGAPDLQTHPESSLITHGIRSRPPDQLVDLKPWRFRGPRCSDPRVRPGSRPPEQWNKR